MGHEHHHSQENFKWAFILNLSFTIIELIGGLITNSVAITSDAIHDLGDSICLGFAYWSEKKAHSSKRNDHYTYGMNRLPLISALLNALILVSGSIGIIVYSLSRLDNPPEVDSQWMIVWAILGIIFNTWAALKLHGGHGLNAKVASLHLLEDVLGWIAVFIGSIIIYNTGLNVIDPILSLAIASFILFNAFKNIRQAYYIIMQKTPDEISIENIKKDLIDIDGIIGVHDLHLWTLEGSKHILTLHVIVNNDTSTKELIAIKQDVRVHLNQLGNIHATIEFEWSSEDCLDKSLSY
jgi:cobalt-zinc-cadmium efflux system protein